MSDSVIQSADFLNLDCIARLRFNIFVELPERFAGPDGERFARLNKSLYGLKQAAHDWFQLQEQFILGFDSGFVKSKSEPCMYYTTNQVDEPALF